MFATIPAYTATLTSEERIISPTHIEEVKPYTSETVPVDPGAVDTPCCLARFFSGQETVILLDMATMKRHLQAITGIVDEFGTIT